MTSLCSFCTTNFTNNNIKVVILMHVFLLDPKIGPRNSCDSGSFLMLKINCINLHSNIGPMHSYDSGDFVC